MAERPARQSPKGAEALCTEAMAAGITRAVIAASSPWAACRSRMRLSAPTGRQAQPGVPCATSRAFSRTARLRRCIAGGGWLAAHAVELVVGPQLHDAGDAVRHGEERRDGGDVPDFSSFEAVPAQHFVV